MTTTAQAVKADDGSTIRIVISHVEGHVVIGFQERWEDMRYFAGRLLELIKEAEANSDPEGK